MAFQNREWGFYLSFPTGGDTPAIATVRVSKAGGPLVTLTAPSYTFTDLTGGIYYLRLAASVLDTVGPLYVEIDYLGAYGTDVRILEVEPSLAAYPIPAMCVVNGNIVDITGAPSAGHQVVFRIAKNPATVGSSFVAGVRIHTMPDAYGSFSVALIRGTKVIVEIDGAGIRQQFVVPDLPTANLIDLLPPITN